MDRSSEGCRVFGLKSTPQAAAFGLGCAAVGALAASLSWGSLEMETSVSPRMSERPHNVSTRQIIGHGVNSNAGLAGEVVYGDSCNHTHHNDNCAFCKARAKRAQEALAAFVPLHERPDYCVEPPDILAVRVTPTSSETWPTETQPLCGEHLVDADGSISLGSWGKLQVAGHNLTEIKHDVEALVDATASHQRVEVSVFQPNSKVYYVVTDFAVGGDSVSRYVVQGNETVLDAIASAGSLNDMGRKRIWIARPTAGGVDTIIPIKWQWSNPTTLVATNPGLLPGDRVFLSTPPSWVSFVDRATRLARNHQANRVPAGSGFGSSK